MKRSGEKALIAGFQAERVTITATQSCKDKKNGQVCDFGLALDQWLAPGFEASERGARHTNARMRRRSASAPLRRAISRNAPKAMFGGYKGIWTEVAHEDGRVDVKGYAVKSSFGLGVGGPQCQSTQEMQAAGGPRHRRASVARSAVRSAACSKKKPEPAAGRSHAAPDYGRRAHAAHDHDD